MGAGLVIPPISMPRKALVNSSSKTGGGAGGREKGEGKKEKKKVKNRKRKKKRKKRKERKERKTSNSRRGSIFLKFIDPIPTH